MTPEQHLSQLAPCVQALGSDSLEQDPDPIWTAQMRPSLAPKRPPNPCLLPPLEAGLERNIGGPSSAGTGIASCFSLSLWLVRNVGMGEAVLLQLSQGDEYVLLTGIR